MRHLLLLGLALFIVLLGVSVDAKNSGQIKRPVLTPLMPKEDLSVVPDPAEKFDQAVQAYQSGQLDEAKKLFEQVLKMDSRNADAHFNLGAIHEWKKDYQGALQHYKQAAAIKPSDSEIRDAVTSLEHKIKNLAIEEVETAKVRQQQELSIHGQKAKEAFARKNYSEAIYHLNHLVETAPDDPKVQFALGQSLRAVKNFDWAAYRLKMAIYLDPQNDLYRRTLAELDHEIRESQDEAYAHFAGVALSRVAPLSFTEAASAGM